jgi:hypothetical protein
MKLEQALTQLQRSILRGMPSVPPSVRSRLARVLSNATHGKVVVARSTSYPDAAVHGYPQVNAAYASYGEAMTLVGDACGSLYPS